VKTRAIRALLRAGWLTARSYRVSLVLSILSLALTIIPLYFVAGALQPLVASSIASETRQYFAFLIVGNMSLSLVATAVNALPGAVSSGIGNGYLESLLVTPASRTSLLVGMSSYALLWSLIRGAVILFAGWLLGVGIAWSHAPAALVILFLIILAHWGMGLVATAFTVAYRTTGRVPQGVLLMSALFGGAYYSTTVLPSWIQSLASITPLAYGLRALRRVLLNDASLGAVSSDVSVLLLFTVVLTAVGALAFSQAMRYAKRSGSLNTY
jgi:ABC-2 type transport system permease protein